MCVYKQTSKEFFKRAIFFVVFRTVFEDQSDVPLDDVVLDPIDFSLPIMKNVGAKWLVKMAEYIADNPQFIVNGFVRVGICQALDGQYSDDELEELLHEMDPTSCISISSDEQEDVENNEFSDEAIAFCSSPSTSGNQEAKVLNTNTPIVLYSSSSEEDI